MQTKNDIIQGVASLGKNDVTWGQANSIWSCTMNLTLAKFKAKIPAKEIAVSLASDFLGDATIKMIVFNVCR